MANTKAQILAFAGSSRKDSLNQKVLKIAVEGAQAAGATVTVIDLAEYPLPLYNGDLEARSGLPEVALKLKEIFHAHQGLLLACPEYNSSITPLLKNTIDWVSRPAPGERSGACYVGKTAALVSASPGALGGLRGLYHVREILMNIQVTVIPGMVAVSKADEALDANGKLKDEKMDQSVRKVGASLAKALGIN